jgi:phosphoglucosamine mutase
MTAPTRKYFGTDGIRGKANTQITPDLVLRIGQAAGIIFQSGNGHNRVVIAKDTRESGYMIETGLTSGFTSVGMDVLVTGPVPTPGLAYLTRSMRCEIGVMISASHNLFGDNGIKLFNPKGEKLSDETELKIEALIDSDMSKYLAPSGKLGRSRRIEGAQDRYVEFAKRSLSSGTSLEGLRVVIDCANGAAYKVAPDALRELGAEVFAIGVEPNGFNINEECGSTDPAALQREVDSHRADLGIALDGDADRVVLCCEKSRLIDGDQILAFFAKNWQQSGKLSNPGVVGTVMSNLGLERFLKHLKMKLVRAPVGDRYVVEEMKKHGYNVGGEQSGHFILSNYGTTGDGLITALQVLEMLKVAGKPASETCHLFEPVPQKLLNVKVQDKKVLDRPNLKTSINRLSKKFAKQGRLLIRPSGTEPVIRVMAESDDADENTSIVNEIAALIESAARH